MLRFALILLLTLAALPARAAPEFNPFAGRVAAAAPITRLIVRLRPDAFARAEVASVTSDMNTAAAAERARLEAAGRVHALGVRTGTALELSHSIAADTHVVHLSVAQDGDLLAFTLNALRLDAEVAYAVPDRRKHAHATTPNDPLYPATPGLGQAGQTGQWYLQAPAATAAGGTTTTAAINATSAWDTTTGLTTLVIADMDTGILFGHPDLLRVSSGGRLLDGYDFVGPDSGLGGPGGPGDTFLTANNGHGWGPDPSDPGDWVTVADNMTTVFKGCLPDPTVPEPSSWHGTRVAGMLGALTNNAIGIAGLTWGPKILPVRVLGKCGGFDSDIIAGMRWAAGLAVPGVPTNPTPAKVLNLSLGGPSECSAAYTTAITDITAKGASIFASAGNEGGPIDEPANCPGVVGVTAVRHVGTKVGFANVSGVHTTGGVSADVSLAAPGGNCFNLTGACLFSLDTTTNAGTTTPDTSATGYTYTNQTNFNIGTSFSSPIAAGIGALMYSVNSQLTPALLLARLKKGARAFPNIATDPTGAAIPMCHVATSSTDLQVIECNCTTTTCGAGLADAPGAVAEALRPIAAISVTGTNANGQTVNFGVTGSSAADTHSLASYAWVVTASTTFAPPTLGAATGATSSLAIPSCGSVTVQLTVTDDMGRTDAVSQVSGQAPAAGTTCPGPAAASSHGGGVFDPAALAVAVFGAAVAIGARRRRRERALH
jgi:serine protease